ADHEARWDVMPTAEIQRPSILGAKEAIQVKDDFLFASLSLFGGANGEHVAGDGACEHLPEQECVWVLVTRSYGVLQLFWGQTKTIHSRSNRCVRAVGDFLAETAEIVNELPNGSSPAMLFLQTAVVVVCALFD